jgi:hypothetical protein
MKTLFAKPQRNKYVYMNTTESEEISHSSKANNSTRGQEIPHIL